MSYCDIVSNVIESAKGAGIRELHEGTILVGSVPHIAEEAWLHQIFKGLSDEEIILLESQLNRKVPQPYRAFLEEMNGAIFFSGSIALYGFRENYHRDQQTIWQPFDLLTPNVYERLADANDTYFFIGGYNWDGSLLYIDTATNFVFRCSRDSSKPLNKWHSFEEMLKVEVNRISSLFDEKGRELDELKATTPPAGARL